MKKDENRGVSSGRKIGKQQTFKKRRFDIAHDKKNMYDQGWKKKGGRPSNTNA